MRLQKPKTDKNFKKPKKTSKLKTVPWSKKILVKHFRTPKEIFYSICNLFSNLYSMPTGDNFSVEAREFWKTTEILNRIEKMRFIKKNAIYFDIKC